MVETLLKVEDLRTYFFTEAGIVKAVDGVNFDVRNGETLALVGETGSGKTVSAYSVMRIVPRPGKIVSGRVIFDGESILEKSEKDVRDLRGRKIAMIFQDPNSSLNPVFTIERQLAEIIRVHDKSASKEAAAKRVAELLGRVGISEPHERMKWYPHQFSGGMRQRIAIARALLLNPELLFADEPTSNLDVTIQAQVLELIKDIKRNMGMSLVLITHDMGIVADMADRVVVLYAGRVAEIASTKTIFHQPLHPYTKALLEAVPRTDVKKGLEPIPGNVPNLIEPPSGCRFNPRCKYAKEVCSQKEPLLEEAKPHHFVSCHRWREVA